MIRTKVRLVVPEEAEAALDMSEKWADVLMVNALRIKARLDGKIRNRHDYEQEIAMPSTERMAEFINPSFVSDSDRSAADILNAHEMNTAEGYKKWQKALDYIFATVNGEDAKRFRDAVSQKKANIAEELGRRALRFTGDRARKIGLAPISAYWLVGYKRAAGMLRAGDEAEGGPFNIVRAGQRTAFKAALQQMVIQAGLLIYLGKYSSSVFSTQNDRLNMLAQSFIDPSLGISSFTTGGLSHIDFRLINERLTLEIQVDQV
ncbi:MAG: hypothetical protein HY811_09990 [Planctomycetes bacterium]|nr:hypothetical protein [Planctomycetota bacterium]